MKIEPYLNFSGQCGEAFKLYEQVFGGKILGSFRFADAPPGNPVPEGWGDKIMHISLRIGDQMIHGCDAPPQYQDKVSGFSVTLGFDSDAEAERVYQALSPGGTITMPIGETFWATRFAMFTDRYGIPWMINVPRPM